MLALLVVSLLAGISLLVSIVRPVHAVYVLVFLAPWFGLDVDVGLRLTAYLVFLFPLAGVIWLGTAISKPQKAIFPGAKFIFLFVLWAVLVTLVQIPLLPGVTVTGGWLRAPFPRAIGQILMFFLTISPVFIIPRVIRQAADIALIGRVYLWSVAILAMLGWVQLLVWYGTGTNPFPIGLIDSLLGGKGEVRVGFYESMLLPINRMNSFGGEPKNLAVSFVIGLMLIQVLLVANINKNTTKLLWLWGFLAISTVATMSTTGFVLWVLGTFTQFAMGLNALTSQRVGAGLGRMVKVVIALCLLILIVVGILEIIGLPIVNLVEERTITRFVESQFGVFEDFDDAVKNYLFAHPLMSIFGVGMGNIHLYADSYLAPEVAEYAGGGVFVAKAQYLRFISEVGFIGLFLFMLWATVLFTRARKMAVPPPFFPTSHVMTTYWAISIIVFLAAGSSSAQFYLTAGSLIASINVFRGHGAKSLYNVLPPQAR